ncbi:MAG: formylmethanofuran--tetrahydromethanopterin N-formyltransferase [Methanobrevibacter boviskoreani]|jgi:formylmethanofuran--tetrahydromethanopterin N-formyltransferase|uniref:formylmethanofuran--tetrahydromethanopterin N-formyltransferase n=1 Tax=Methanobrevibacter boviskoreani TaxID=1348249 RepID=UPI0005945620|nr:formylmethanofuran--tetrahydromethanopterin N-formyltransferase [Methanobrevibacter boviskoreani]MCI6931433.1 formylmethanofuran--tetrahydromethanopterin N-formyltransferase [Methanobrevibacter boviskoreani]
MTDYSLVEDTFFESFRGKYIRALITAEDEQTAKEAAYDSTATPSSVIGRIEGGVEGPVSANFTPDGRPGYMAQYWFGLDDLKKYELELSYRIRQDILVKPFTSMFSATENPDGYIGMMEQVGHCGDGYEWEENIYGRDMIHVPIAVPDFLIDKEMGYGNGIMGANFWYMCSTKEAVLEAGRNIVDAILNVPGACAPFGVCSAASKPETNFPQIGPSTNHPFCPSLKERLGDESKVPDGVNYIPEIVIDAVNEESMRKAVKAAIDSILDIDGIVKISAGNFGGKLGEDTFYLHDILGI